MSMIRFSGLLGVAAMGLASVACSSAGDEPVETAERPSPEEQGLTLGERLKLDTGGSVQVVNAGEVALVSAGFFEKQRPTCKKLPVGAFCMVTTCSEGQSPATGTNLNAGPITVQSATGSTVIAPQPDGSYFDFVVPPPSSPITVSAPGASFPAFAFANVALPSPLTAVTSPSPVQPVGTPDTEVLTIDRSRGLRVAWTGGDQWVDILLTHGVGVRVEVAPKVFEFNSTSQVVLDCSVPARFGEFVIPRAALALFPAGAGTPDPTHVVGQPVVKHFFGVTSTGHHVKWAWVHGRLAPVDLVVQDAKQFGSDLVTFR